VAWVPTSSSFHDSHKEVTWLILSVAAQLYLQAGPRENLVAHLLKWTPTKKHVRLILSAKVVAHVVMGPPHISYLVMVNLAINEMHAVSHLISHLRDISYHHHHSRDISPAQTDIVRKLLHKAFHSFENPNYFSYLHEAGNEKDRPLIQSRFCDLLVLICM